MMGPRQEFQTALFYEFNLEGHVPNGHLLRSVDRFVDLSDMRSHLRPFYSDIGRPSIDPELMIRMLLIGYTMGNWAVDREIVADNPVYGMTRPDLKNTYEAGRALTDDELRAIWHAAAEIGYPFGPLFQLLMLTGQRRNEWAAAQRSEIDVVKRCLEIPRDRYKGGRDHIVPLPDNVWAIVDALPLWPGDYLFSTTDGKRPVSGFSRAKSRLDKSAQQILQDSSSEPGLAGRFHIVAFLF